MATYTSFKTGLWSDPTVWVGGVKPPTSSGHKIVIATGHIVTYDEANGEYGDDAAHSTTNTISNCSIVVNGTLSASRTMSTSLTARGSIGVASGGVFDWGTQDSPIPVQYNSTITLNYSLTPATNKHILACGSGSSLFLYGSQKTRNSYLTTGANAGATDIIVNDVTGWAIGDRVVIESDTTVHTRAHLTTILNLNGNTVTLVAGLNFARVSGSKIGNLSSNVVIKPFSAANPSSVTYQFDNSGLNKFVCNNARFENLGSRSNWTGSSADPWNSPATTCGLGLAIGAAITDASVESCAFEETGSYGTYNLGFFRSSSSVISVKNSCFYSPIDTNYGLYITSSGNPLIENCNFYRVGRVNLAFGEGSGNSVFKNCLIQSSAGTVQSTGIATFNNCKLKSNTTIIVPTLFNVKLNTCDIYSTGVIVQPGTGALGDITFNNCAFNNINLIAPHTSRSSLTNITKVNIINGDTLDNRLYNYYYTGQTNLSVRKNGITSLRFKPNAENIRFYSYLSIPAQGGVSQRIKCNLRFDSTYGTTNPPSITFDGAGVSQTFTCPAVADIWHSVDLTLNPTSTEDIAVTISGLSNSTSGFVYLDGLPIDPYIQTARWYGFEYDKNAYRTVNSLTTLTENQVSALGFISNLDELYDAANYWSIINPASSSYIDLYTVNGTVLDFGSKNIVINNTGTALSYISATNTIVLDAPSLSAGNNFNTLKTTGTVTLSTGLISNIDINANIVQNTPTNLTGIFMLSASNTLTYNTNTPIEIEYTNCTMVGVQNSGTAIITIKRTNSTVTENDAEILTYAPTLINLTLLSGYIALYNDSDIRQYYQNTDGTLVLPANATGNWSYRIARYGYQLVYSNFTINPNVGGIIDINPNYIPDTYITENSVSVVSAYTDLNTPDKIHDYLSYYLTTSAGIDYGDLETESFGVINFNTPLTINSAAAKTADYSGGVLTIKASNITGDITFVVNGNLTLSGTSTLSDGIKVRSNNFDSEIYFYNITSITLYPSLSDRDNNTNPGDTATGAIYRFKYGSTYSGVTMSSPIYARVTTGGVTLIYSTPITTGTTTIDLGVVGTLQSVIQNQKILNTGIQKASKLIPHTTNLAV